MKLEDAYPDRLLETESYVKQQLAQIKIKIEDANFMLNKYRTESFANPNDEAIKINIGFTEWILADLNVIFENKRAEAITKRRAELTLTTNNKFIEYVNG